MKKYTKKQGDLLLKLARKSIEQEFSKEIKIPENKEFKIKTGVFVTLTKNNKLRGCIGFPHPILPLNKAIINSAKSAAFSDPRFPCMQKKELKDIKIEISILTQPELCSIQDFEINKHGLICQCNNNSSLLLPQVAKEHNMNKHDFLKCLCQKAGLSESSLNNPDFRLYRFQVQIFKEE